MAEKVGPLLFSDKYLGLADSFKVNPCSCDDGNVYERYLKSGALDEQKNGDCVTHIIIDTEPEKIIGYVTLRASSLNTREYKGDFGCFPAIEILKVAVDIDYERQNFGTELLDTVIHYANEIRKNYIGVEYIVVCADLKAVGFYQKCGFEKCEDKNYEIPGVKKILSIFKGQQIQLNSNLYLKLPSLA